MQSRRWSALRVSMGEGGVSGEFTVAIWGKSFESIVKTRILILLFYCDPGTVIGTPLSEGLNFNIKGTAF